MSKVRIPNVPGPAGVHCFFGLVVLMLVIPSSTKANVPILISQTNSTRAIALEAVTLRREPFNPTSRWGQDGRTRIVLFARNLENATLPELTAEAEDGSHRHYSLAVEHVALIPGLEVAGISQVTLRLSDNIGFVGDVLVQITYRGVSSNRVRVGIGYVGDGLPDDDVAIEGRVTTTSGLGLGGVVVTVSGPSGGITATDEVGNYSLSNLVPGANYTVTVSKTSYTFEPPKESITGLVGRQLANFTGTIANYTIGGQITDNGTPLSGIAVTLSGSQSVTTTTDASGNYSFSVPAEGNYLVMPIVLDYNLTPASFAVTNLASNQILNFKKTFDLFYVLEFDGSPQSVDYGDFFQLQPGQSQLGKFFWELWAMPGSDALARYMLSDGYGGAHAILFGFVGSSDGTRYSLYGNIWNGTTAIDFGSDDGPAPNEWGHLAVGWDESYIYTYFNGVPVGLKPFSGPRMPAGSDNGGGRLFIGGSDHNNFMGRIAQVRGFENSNPRDHGLQTVPYRPDTIFGLTPGTKTSPTSSFLTSFLRPGLMIPDLAGGRTGVLKGTAFGATNPISSYPLPQFVIDPNAPNTSTLRGPVAPAVQVDTPSPVPDNALIFDSFSRMNSTYAFAGHGGLGTTEGGSAGQKEWKTAGTGATSAQGEAFGILNGRAVSLSDSIYGSLAWVETGSNTGYLFTSVSRNPGFYKTGIDTGISFRVVDSSNYFFAFSYGDPISAADRKLIVGYWLDSKITYLQTAVPMPEDWTKLQVVTTAAGNIDVYADTTLVYSATSDVLATATGVGLFNFSDYYALANRWDNFTVYDRP